MKAVIYYFSGSGHSLALARELAEALGGEAIAIARQMEQAGQMERARIWPEAEVVGLVFPVYYASFGESGLPQLVERFVQKLEGLAGCYLFAACTHAGNPGRTLEALGEGLQARGGQLSAGYAVNMGQTYTPAEKLLHVLLRRPLEARESPGPQRLLDRQARALAEIVARTRAREVHLPRPSTPVAPWIWLQKQIALARYRRLAGSGPADFAELVRQADRSFDVSERCTGCGTCARVCPVANIRLVAGRPVWQHHCETCYACYQWCPQQAIGGEIVHYEKRCHHPAVSLADVLGQRAQP